MSTKTSTGQSLIFAKNYGASVIMKYLLLIFCDRQFQITIKLSNFGISVKYLSEGIVSN